MTDEPTEEPVVPSEPTKTAADVPLPGGEFQLFVTRLAYQLMMSCGLLENPVTKQRNPHPDNARMLIADLKMLQSKTVGNLSDDEQAHIDKVLSDLTPVVERL
jgi:hypothetical protein